MALIVATESGGYTEISNSLVTSSNLQFSPVKTIATDGNLNITTKDKVVVVENGDSQQTQIWSSE